MSSVLQDYTLDEEDEFPKENLLSLRSKSANWAWKSHFEVDVLCLEAWS